MLIAKSGHAPMPLGGAVATFNLGALWNQQGLGTPLSLYGTPPQAYMADTSSTNASKFMQGLGLQGEVSSKRSK